MDVTVYSHLGECIETVEMEVVTFVQLQELEWKLKPNQILLLPKFHKNLHQHNLKQESCQPNKEAYVCSMEKERDAL